MGHLPVLWGVEGNLALRVRYGATRTNSLSLLRRLYFHLIGVSDTVLNGCQPNRAKENSVLRER